MSSSKINPIERELVTNRFRSLVLEMGDYLQRTSLSTNIKERMDFSCGMLDENCQLIVNAPHIPVHLGALGLFAEKVTEILPLNSGDVAISNHPAFGGSHLPDITLIAPVDFEGKRLGYLANRAHHAELGGRNPGSLVPDATSLKDEGVVIHPFKLVENGEANWKKMSEVLSSARYPTRALEENIADLRAQLASINKGTETLINLAKELGTDHLKVLMEEILRDADERLQKIWKSMDGKSFSAEEKMDQGFSIKVSIEVKKNKACFDFSGTTGIHQGNLNATPAIVQSAVLYVLRIMTDHEVPPLPLNSGLLRSVSFKLPGNTFLNPDKDPDEYPAVMGGNVEVSQRLVDTLIKAFELGACSQGTMNNFVFGNDSFGMYETICGGAGATENGDGASAVHTNMTNTKITDPEILERRFPVRIKEFSIRKNSGGKGKYKGGDGVIREFEFLEPVTISVMAEHRKEVPYGMKGGEPGTVGKQFINRNNEWDEIDGSTSMTLETGDRFKIETPGGGGFGSAKD